MIRFMQWVNALVRKWHALSLFVKWIVLISIALVALVILFPMFPQKRHTPRRIVCLMNQKQLALAVLMYTQEHDGMLPSSDQWVSETGIPAQWLRCPMATADLDMSYAYHRELSQRTLEEFKGQEADTPLTFDAREGQPAFRHNNGLNASYLDGHVEFKKDFSLQPLPAAMEDKSQ